MSDKSQKLPRSRRNTILPTLPPYQHAPPWVPEEERATNSLYNSNLITYLPRSIYLERQDGQALGFNIRGGPENEYGVYISKVLPGSEAERLGLKKCDKVLQVNNVDYSNISHEEAVMNFQDSKSLEIKVRHFPFGFQLQQERIGMI